MTKTINNNPDEWKNLKYEIENDLLNTQPYEEKNLQIEVHVKNNPENLIYSFPIVDSARILKWKCNINIIIDKQKPELINSVSHFLCVQSIIREGLTITINGKKLERQARFGKIQPVIAVINKSGKFCYQHLYEPQISFDLLFTLKPILISSIIYKKNDIRIIDNLKSIISLHKDLISNTFIQSNNNILAFHQTDKKIIWSELFEVQQNDNINLILCKFIMSNIIYMMENLSGNRENKLSKQQKEEIANKLFDYFEDTAQDLPLLSLYIWSILLRFLLIKKELIHPDTQKQDLFKPIMETTANRAISFGEGLYQLIENSCFHSCVQTGYFYLRVYGKNKENDLKEEEKQIRDLQTLARRYSPHTFSKETDLYLEICFIDSAFDTRGTSGMIDHYNRTHQNKNANSLIELFESQPDSEEDLTEHYGLRFFRRTVFNNHGAFIISTPNSQNVNDGYMYRLTNGKYSNEINKVYNGTVYQVVFPLILNYTSNTTISKNDSNDLFETENITKTIKPFCICLNTTPEYKSILDKNKCIETIRNELEMLFPSDKELNERIVCINPKNFNFSHIEILAKALIRVMLKRKHLSLKIALMLDTDYKIYEFIRVFSAFYDKHGGNFQHFELSNAEIALCRLKDDYPEVCSVLKGDSLESALKTTRNFIYYQSNSLMKFLPTITYLTNVENNEFLPQKKVFPFDLYLDIDHFDAYNNNKSEIDEDKTWFFRRINHILNSEMQFNPYGCKISNVHVSIGSKIHIDTFYNAEVLFHNYSNIFRFAYIVAQNLLREHIDDAGKKLILIAYGEYSLIMIQKVCDIINEFDEIDLYAEYFVFPSYLDEDNIKSRDEQENEFQSFINRHNIDENDTFSDYCFHIIIPVSTTLTTTIRIQNAIKRVSNRRFPKARIEFGENTTLVLVGGIKDNFGIDNHYWEKVEPNAKQLVIMPSSVKKENITSRTVRYYFNVEGKWYKAIDDKCELCNNQKNAVNRKSLIGVDKTSTLPSSIFDSMVTAGKFFLSEKEANNKQKNKDNKKRLAMLMGTVKYAHMTKNYNHFLYDIDYKKYTEKKEVQNEISAWIDNELINHIDYSAFNIIVSPLHSSNSFFLKSVIEQGFKGNCRLINLKFHNSYRDEVRSRLEFITNEYRHLKALGMADNLHTYFVDDCIIEGSTLQRSKQFLYMLLSEYGFEISKLPLYKGIILLANRSSYDTINNLLPGRVEDDFHYFVRVNVPSFNSRNGKCPACDLAEKYRLSHKQASTFLLAGEYRRLYNKHTGKTDLEYEKWLDNNSRKEKNYTIRFSYWLYYAVCKAKDGYGIADINGNIKLFADNDKTVKPEFSYLEFLFTDFNLDQILGGLDNPDFEKYFSPLGTDKETYEKRLYYLRSIVEKHIIDERSYERMICTHDLFMAREKVLSDSIGKIKDTQEYEELLRENIIKMMEQRLKVITQIAEKSKLSARTINWLKTEWIISYCKVISRKQPGQYYHLRNAIYNILSDVLDCVLYDSKMHKDVSFIAEMCSVMPTDRCSKKAMPDMTYRLFITVIRRVSAMYSNYLINHLKDVFEWFEKMEKQINCQDEYANFFESEKTRRIYSQMVTVPSKQDFEFDIARLIKWISVSGLDDSKSYSIEKLLTEKLDTFSTSNECDKIAYLENTSIIYSGIRKLSLGCSNEMHTSEEIYDYIKQTLENAIPVKASPNQYYEMNPYKTFLQFMDCRTEYKAGFEKQFYRIIANQVLLFKRLCSLEAISNRIVNPYDYVHICNYIKNIMHYHQCVIASGHEKVCILATSDIHKNYLENNLNEGVLYEIIDRYYQKREQFSLQTIVQKYKIGKTAEVFVLPVTFDEKNDSGTFIILYKNPVSSDEIEQEDFCLKDLWNLRNVLFIRDRLEHVLHRDLDQLHNMIDSYHYIEKISKSEIATIMHISDLHISVQEALKLKTRIETLSIKETPDLLLITGDVINGNYSAAGLKEAYSSAESVIKALVKQIWSLKDEDEEYIRSDWKKRILISLGNHDYASMNELKAQNKKRVTTAGTPGALGDIMIKHSYFIHFVHKLLGTDIDTLIKFDMNRIVNYKSLGISVVNLNSNSNVNPLKTNKVRINRKEVDELFKHSTHQPLLVYMIHHTPLYDIDYIDDVYYLGNSTLIEKARIAIEKHGLKVPADQEVNNVWVKLIKSLSADFQRDVFSLSPEKQKALLKEIIDLYKSYDEKNYIENNIDEFLYYCNSDDAATDDKCRHIKYAIEEQLYSTKMDTDNFKAFCEEHFADLRKKTDNLRFFILGGHTHQARTLTDHFTGVFDKCEGIFETGKFFGKTLNYYTLSINTDKLDFTSVGETPVKKDLSNSMIKEIMDKPIF